MNLNESIKDSRRRLLKNECSLLDESIKDSRRRLLKNECSLLECIECPKCNTKDETIKSRTVDSMSSSLLAIRINSWLLVLITTSQLILV